MIKNQSGIDPSSCFLLWNNLVYRSYTNRAQLLLEKKKNSSLLWDFTKKVTVNFVGLESRLSFVCLRVCRNTWTRKPLTPLKRYFHHPPPLKVSRAERLKLNGLPILEKKITFISICLTSPYQSKWGLRVRKWVSQLLFILTIQTITGYLWYNSW